MPRLVLLQILFFAAILPSLFGELRQPGATPAQVTEIRNLLEKEVKDQHLAGMAAIVVRSHTIIGLATTGVKRSGESRPLGSDDMMHLGSNTKAITATMIARLVEAGSLRWTATPLEIFPELNATMHPAFRRVTIEQLLSHHAGIPPYADFKAWPKLNGSAVQQRSKFAAWVLTRAPATKPGTKGLYSNAGFAIAAAMAERRTGLSWEDLVISQVLEPMGMQAIFGFPLSAGSNQPWGHTETEKELKAVPGGGVELPRYLLPAGGMSIALGDYGRFLQMNLKGLRGEDHPFLSAKTIQRLHSSAMHDEYALGWGSTKVADVPSSTHAGSAGSFYALVALQPSRDVGVAVILNSAGERSAKAADSLLEALLIKYAAAPERIGSTSPRTIGMEPALTHAVLRPLRR